ncbi:MAG: type II toxin-antitoxin system HicB family antitoxin, partial [Verrucomicrobia bacterium]|nr:type II toxin-antitoxin system HicB family antitoxin [Verrucomicrobiota bacterium]
MKTRLTAVISQEGNDYVALNPDLDIASQGDTPESALTNLREAVDPIFEMFGITESEDLDDPT